MTGAGGTAEANCQKTDIRAGTPEAGGILTVADALSEREVLAITSQSANTNKARNAGSPPSTLAPRCRWRGAVHCINSRGWTAASGVWILPLIVVSLLGKGERAWNAGLSPY